MRGVAVTLAGFAVIALLLAWSRWLARHRLASLGHAAMAVCAAVLGTILWRVAGGLEGFEPLRPGGAVAEMRVTPDGPGRSKGTLVRLPRGSVQVFELPGEEWRITAATLEWHGIAASSGLHPAIRVEKLESRGSSESAPSSGPGRVYRVAETAGLDVWTVAHESSLWSRFVTAGLADSPWRPVSQAGRYVVRFQGGALLVEPAPGSETSLSPGR